MPNRIKELRKKINMTQEELGEKIGIKKSAVAKYENGDIANIKKATAEKIADVFGVNPAYVFGWTDSENDLTCDERELVDMYGRLNSTGKGKARRMVNGLTAIPAFVSNANLSIMPVAAHSDGVEYEELKNDIEKALMLFGDKIRGDEFGV